VIHCLLLGATGVGKTRLGQAWAKQNDLGFVDLDQQLSQAYRYPHLAQALSQWGLPLFYQRSLEQIQSLDQSTQALIVAVGAGTQLAAQGALDLLNWRHLCLSAEAHWLWQQNQIYRQDPRSFDDFCAIEYHVWRQQIYQHSQMMLDVTGLSRQTVLAQALDLF